MAKIERGEFLHCTFSAHLLLLNYHKSVLETFAQSNYLPREGGADILMDPSLVYFRRSEAFTVQGFRFCFAQTRYRIPVWTWAVM